MIEGRAEGHPLGTHIPGSLSLGKEMTMVKNRTILIFLTVLAVFYLQPPAGAQSPVPSQTAEQAKSPATFLQLSILHPVQIFKPVYTVRGLRFNLFYGLNQNLSGIDLGMVNRLNGNVKGLQMGLANLGGGAFSGLQLGLINTARGDTRGFQAGLYNSSGDTKGMQLGLLNTAQRMKGLQIGLINHCTTSSGIQVGLLYNSAETLEGLQVGLLNFAWTKEPLMFFPIVNYRFE